MQEQNSFQLELFSQSSVPGAQDTKQRGYFLSRLWNYQKTILIIIGIIMISLIAFSLGVEKGKRLSILKSRPYLDIAQTVEQPQARPQAQPQAKPQAQPQARPQAQLLLAKPQAAQTERISAGSRGGYVIQLGSFKSKVTLQKEAESLRKKGFSPMVLSKGSYSVLYVGNFINKETAQSQLVELRKLFKDCYIRRL